MNVPAGKELFNQLRAKERARCLFPRRKFSEFSGLSRTFFVVFAPLEVIFILPCDKGIKKSRDPSERNAGTRSVVHFQI